MQFKSQNWSLPPCSDFVKPLGTLFNRTVSPIFLRPLKIEDEFQAKMAHFELAADSFEFLFDWTPETPWADYVQMMADFSEGKNLPANRVRADLLVAVDESENIIGRLSVRYEFNDFLKEYGGHVGYAVRPQYRGHGYATKMLKAGVEILGKTGISEVLVTCFADNLGSAAVIKKAGGVFDGARELNGRTMHRYLIATQA